MMVWQGMCACRIWDLLPGVNFHTCGYCGQRPRIVGVDYL